MATAAEPAAAGVAAIVAAVGVAAAVAVVAAPDTPPPAGQGISATVRGLPMGTGALAI